MIGIVLVAHAPLGGALVACARHVYGRAPEAFRVVDVIADADPAVHVEQARRAIEAVDQGDGVLVMVDLFGATPGNVATQLAQPGRVDVVAGVNLPMLVRVLCYRESAALDVLTEKAVKGGAAAIQKIASVPIQDQPRFAASLSPCEGSKSDDARLSDPQ